MPSKINKTKPAVNRGLVGMCFHSFENGKIQWQGIVHAKITEEVYLVVPFDFLIGDPSSGRLVTLSEMKTWLFYATPEEMRFSYEHGEASSIARKATLSQKEKA